MEAIQAQIRAEGSLAGVHFGVTAAQMSFPCGWSEKLAAMAWSFILLWGYFIMQSNNVIFVGSIALFFFPNSLFPREANRTPWPLHVPERLINIEAQRRLLFFSRPCWHLCFSPVWKWMQPLASSAQPVIVLHIFPRIIVSDLFLLDNHGITHAVLDYSGWQADVEVITIHLLIPFLFYGNERIFSLAISLLTASHFLPFLSPLCPTPPSSCITSPILLPVPLKVSQRLKCCLEPKKKIKNESKPGLCAKLSKCLP